MRKKYILVGMLSAVVGLLSIHVPARATDVRGYDSQREAVLSDTMQSSLGLAATADDISEVGGNETADLSLIDAMPGDKDIAPLATADSSFTWNGNSITKYVGSDEVVVILARAIEIGAEAFKGNTMIKAVSFEEGSQCFRILHDAFNGCTNLEAVFTPDALELIDYNAFLGAKSLTGVVLSEGLITIGASAFRGCDLREITIPRNVQNVYNKAFQSNGNLQKVTIESAKIGDDGRRSDYAEYSVFSGSNINELILNDDMPTIPFALFYYAGFQIGTHVDLPRSVTEIKGCAFYGASNLNSLLLPVTLETVRKNAFYGCSGLKEVTYAGTEDAWTEVTVEAGNDAIQPPTQFLGQSKSSQYTVTFETNGGGAVDAQTVQKNGKAKEPAAPTRSGYVFAGWYADAALQQAYDFDTPVTKDTVIYARWTNGISYTVSFETNGGTTVEVQTVQENGKAKKPADPKKTGYAFAGWYADAALKKAYDFNTVVTKDTIIYAKWTKETSDDPEPPKGVFTIGRDSNHFGNLSGDFFNKGEEENYRFKNDDYYQKFVSISNESNAQIKTLREWKGSCGGIATTMGLVFTGRLNLSDITNKDAAVFHDLGAPREDEKLHDIVNFYQVAYQQNYKRTLITKADRDQNGNWDTEFLKNLVELTKDHTPRLLVYEATRPDRFICHAILALNSSYDAENDRYVITLFDENTASGASNKSETERTDVFYISGDYTSCTFPQYGYFDAYVTSMRIQDLSKMMLLTNVDAGAPASLKQDVDSGDHVIIEVLANSETVITNAEGSKLTVSKGKLDGDMLVYDHLIIAADVDPVIRIEVGFSNHFTIESNNMEVSIFNQDDSMMLRGDDLDSVTIDLTNDTMDIKGEKYSFDAFFTGENVDTVRSMSADATGNTTVSARGNLISTSSDGTMGNVASKTYEGITSTDEAVTKTEQGFEATHTPVKTVALDNTAINLNLRCEVDGGDQSKELRDGQERGRDGQESRNSQDHRHLWRVCGHL